MASKKTGTNQSLLDTFLFNQFQNTKLPKNPNHWMLKNDHSPWRPWIKKSSFSKPAKEETVRRRKEAFFSLKGEKKRETKTQ